MFKDSFEQKFAEHDRTLNMLSTQVSEISKETRDVELHGQVQELRALPDSFKGHAFWPQRYRGMITVGIRERMAVDMSTISDITSRQVEPLQ